MHKKRNKAKGESTVIGKGTTINGPVVSDAIIMRVDGVINGEVTTDGDIIVGCDGIIVGDIKAHSLILAGKIEGNVELQYRLEMEANGILKGDVNTLLLSIDETAVLNGTINMAMAVNTMKDDKEAYKAEAKASDQKNADAKVEEKKASVQKTDADKADDKKAKNQA